MYKTEKLDPKHFNNIATAPFRLCINFKQDRDNPNISNHILKLNKTKTNSN